ncbi:MAG: hypothetical protein ACJAZ0_002247 [Halioglobus sp.]|jgi:hypothetical protein
MISTKGVIRMKKSSNTDQFASRGPARHANYFRWSQPMLCKQIKVGTIRPGVVITENGMRVWFDDELEAEMDSRIALYNGVQTHDATTYQSILLRLM